MLNRTAAGAFRMRIVAKPRYKVERARGGYDAFARSACTNCPMLEECRGCVADGRVMACEAADQLDAAGTRLRGGLRGLAANK